MHKPGQIFFQSYLVQLTSCYPQNIASEEIACFQSEMNNYSPSSFSTASQGPPLLRHNISLDKQMQPPYTQPVRKKCLNRKYINDCSALKMKIYPKFKLPLLAIVVAILTTIAFTVHCDDTPFKSFTRSFVKQKITSLDPTSKIKTDISTDFFGNTSTILNNNVVSSRWKSGSLIQNPTLTFTESIPPYRGPPTSIPL
jgi:hypothetical protein